MSEGKERQESEKAVSHVSELVFSDEDGQTAQRETRNSELSILLKGQGNQLCVKMSNTGQV